MILNRFPDKTQYLRLAERYRVVPVCTQVLADTLTPVSLLGRFYEGRGPVFLFESVEGGERWARYSFLGFSAHMLVRVFADAVEIEQAGSARRVPHRGNPFQVLRELLAPYRPADVFGLPRFWGGLVGHLNYEMVSFIEAIPHDWPADKPLACFMVPETVLIFDNSRHTLIVAALTFPNGDPERDWAEAEARLERVLDTIAAPMPRPPVADNGRPELAATVPDEQFRSQVRAVKEHIRAGDIIQAVLSQSLRQPDGARPLAPLPRHALRQPVAVPLLPAPGRHACSSARRPRPWCGLRTGSPPCARSPEPGRAARPSRRTARWPTNSCRTRRSGPST